MSTIDTSWIDKPKALPAVHFPAEVEEEHFCGSLYGFFHEDTLHFNVRFYGEVPPVELEYLGKIYSAEEPPDKSGLYGLWEENSLTFYYEGRKCTNKPYESKLNIFSRNSGILETDDMMETSVIISGIGSVGSLVALEMARSGVGKFLLVDSDVMEYHNICRHQCDITDVGRYKTEAIKERVLKINPFAEVYTFEGILEQVPKKLFDDFVDSRTVIIGCSDNREGNIYANEVAFSYDVPLLALGFWERAAAGEVFYTIPGEMPCYECVFGNGQNLGTEQEEYANRRFYTTEEDLRNTNFEPGISVDISFVTNVGIKFALDLLNRNNSSYTTRLLNELTQYTLICNTNNTDIGGEYVEIFSYPLQITRSVEVEFSENCSMCKVRENKK